ncbi:MAG: hypothetical protein M3O71_01380 [Bacteroidota bacterium]|nr:hypothetical protein [Bacteroidota bacterium]
MKQYELPTIKNIKKYKFYDLSEYGWIFQNTNEGIENNKPIYEEISHDFSEYSNMSFEQILKAFDIDYIYTRSTEHFLMLYTEIGSEDVYYQFVNANFQIYQELQNK